MAVVGTGDDHGRLGVRATILIEPDFIYVGKAGHVDAFDHVGAWRWRQPLHGMGHGRISLALPGNVAQADDVGRE